MTLIDSPVIVRLLKILSRYDELLFFLWHFKFKLVLSSFTQSFTREYGTWKSVSGQPNLWKLHGFSISIDLDNEDVRLLLVSPLAEGDLARMARAILSDKDQIITFVSTPSLCHIHRLSNLIISDPGHCHWLEDFALFRHNPWRPSGSTSLVVIYPSHSFYFETV